MIEEFGLPAELIVGESVGGVRARGGELRHAIGPGCITKEATVLIEAARPEALREGVIHHRVRHEMPGQVRTALPAGLRAAQILRVEVIRIRGLAATLRHAAL